MLLFQFASTVKSNDKNTHPGEGVIKILAGVDKTYTSG